MKRVKMIGEQEKTDIISVKSYYSSLLIGALPIIGEILLLKWMKSNNVRENKRNLCKAYLLLKVTVLYPTVVLLVLLISSVARGCIKE